MSNERECLAGLKPLNRERIYWDEDILFDEGIRNMEGSSFIAMHPMIASFLSPSFFSLSSSSIHSRHLPSHQCRSQITLEQRGQVRLIQSHLSEEMMGEADLRRRRRVTPLKWGNLWELYLNRSSFPPLMWRERTNWSINFMYTSVRTFPSSDF